MNNIKPNNKYLYHIGDNDDSILACVKYRGEFYFLHLCPDYMFSDNILKFYKICRINNEKYRA